ncbi:MAG: Phospho-N-acetylmuramoyl-pentapeptide-transferase, partial [Microgenomates group bacterium LiPW_16]
MALLLFLLMASFFTTGVLLIPFIDLLYRLRFQRQKQKTLDIFEQPTPIFDRLHRGKVGIPVGGGILIILIVFPLLLISLLMMYYFWLPITSVYPIVNEVKILLFTFLSFGILGLYDDAKKTFVAIQEKFFGLRLRHKLILELVLAGIIAFWLYNDLKIQIVNIPFLGVANLGWWYIPFAAFVITSFANAFNITDGLELLLICLLAFWVISAGILDVPLATFIALWLGSLIAFLYFNIYPARIFLGDTGALSFGATMAVIGLLLGKVAALVVIGGVFVAEVASSLLQLSAKKFLGRKLLSVAPLHLWFQEKGWEEPKVV